MKPADLKPGTWLVIREPLDDRAYHACFIERLESLGYGDPALSRLCCSEWIGQPGTDEAGCRTFTDTVLIHRGSVLLEEFFNPLPDPVDASSQPASQASPAVDTLGLELAPASPEIQATAVLSKKATEQWRERVRLALLERLQRQPLDSQDLARFDADRASAAGPEHSSIPHKLHTQLEGRPDVSGTSSCALRGSTVRTQRSHWLVLSSRRATAHKARPLTRRERALLALHPVRLWLPAPVRLLVERIYVAASLRSSYERVASKGNAKGGDHA